MLQSRNSYQVWWTYADPIAAVTSIVMPIGCNFNNAFSPAGLGVGLVRDLPHFSFSLSGTYTTATLAMEVYVGSVTGALQLWFTHVHSGSTAVDTVHNLAAPYGNANGTIVISTQYLRINLAVGGTGNVTALQFMARAWK